MSNQNINKKEAQVAEEKVATPRASNSVHKNVNQVQCWVDQGNWNSDEESFPMPNEPTGGGKVSSISSMSSGAYLLNSEGFPSDVVEIDKSQVNELSESDYYASGAPLEFSVSTDEDTPQEVELEQGNSPVKPESIASTQVTPRSSNMLLSLVPTRIKQIIDDWTPKRSSTKIPSTKENDENIEYPAFEDKDDIELHEEKPGGDEHSISLENIKIAESQPNYPSTSKQALEEMKLKTQSSADSAVKPNGSGDCETKSVEEYEDIYSSAEVLWLNELYQSKQGTMQSEPNFKEELESDATKSVTNLIRGQIFDEKTYEEEFNNRLLALGIQNSLDDSNTSVHICSETEAKGRSIGSRTLDENGKEIIFDDKYLGRSDIFHPLLTTVEKKMLGVQDSPKPGPSRCVRGHTQVKRAISYKNSIDNGEENFTANCADKPSRIRNISPTNSIDEMMNKTSSTLKGEQVNERSQESDDSSIVPLHRCDRKESNSNGAGGLGSRKYDTFSDIETAPEEKGVGDGDTSQKIKNLLPIWELSDSQSEEKQKSNELQDLIQSLPFYESKKKLKKVMKKDINNFKKESKLVAHELRAKMLAEDRKLKECFASQINESKADIKKKVHEAKLSFIEKQESMQQDLLKGKLRKILEKYRADCTSTQLKYQNKMVRVQAQMELKLNKLKMKQETEEKKLKNSMKKELHNLENQIRMKKLHVYSIKDELDMSSLQDLLGDLSITKDE